MRRDSDGVTDFTVLYFEYLHYWHAIRSRLITVTHLETQSQEDRFVVLFDHAHKPDLPGLQIGYIKLEISQASGREPELLRRKLNQVS
jgi:hypothetical protein